MTGEITLRGEVLPVGGVKEKVLAARQAKIRTIVLPRLNKRDVSQISARILHGIEFQYVDRVDEVLAIALSADVAPAPVAEPPAPEEIPAPTAEIPVRAAKPGRVRANREPRA